MNAIRKHLNLDQRTYCLLDLQVKGIVYHTTSHEGPTGEQIYSSTLSLTSAQVGVGGQRHAPAALPSGKTRSPSYRGADKSLARPTSRCILFDGENISFDASLVLYIYTPRIRLHPFTGHEGPQGEQRYSSTLFQTSALEGGEGSTSRPGSTLPPGKTRYPLYRRLGGPQGRSGLVRKISPHRDSIPGPSSPQAVAIPNTLPDPR